MKETLSRILMLSLLLILASSSSSPPPPLHTFNLTRDAFGVPHVRAATDAGALFGVGVAQAEDRLYQLLTQRLAARGRAAEIFGPGAAGANIASDVHVRTLGWAQYAERVVASMPRVDLALLNSYADGVK
jgi:penicillin amidase